MSSVPNHSIVNDILDSLVGELEAMLADYEDASRLLSPEEQEILKSHLSEFSQHKGSRFVSAMTSTISTQLGV